MTDIKVKTTTHPTEAELADFLSNTLAIAKRRRLEEHIASCEECLGKIVSAHESVEEFNKKSPAKNGKDNPMKRLNLYLMLAIISFVLSFAIPRYFLQLLVATLLLGAKWIADSKSTKMLVMIYEAWKKGGEKEASRILEKFDSGHKNRF